MRFLVCYSDITPCPDAASAWLSIGDVMDLSAMGITPELVMKAYAFGAGSVVSWWAVGFVLAVAIKAMNKA